jgi:hypothetical protein
MHAVIAATDALGYPLVVLLGERGRPRARRMLTELDPSQHRLYDLFNLNTHAPTR